MKDGLLGGVGLQAEDASGEPVGSIIHLTGVREFDPVFDPVDRTTKVNVWRHEQEQEHVAKTWRGRLDFEATSGAALDLFLANFFTLKSEAESGGTVNVYRPRRAGPASVPTIRFLAFYEGGPWLRFEGCVVDSIRVTIRANELVHVSIDWLAQWLTRITTDPEWAFVYQVADPMHGQQATLKLDDVDQESFLELSVAFECSRGFQNMSRVGRFRRLTRGGPTTISGTLSHYYDDDLQLPEGARDGREFALSVSFPSGFGFEMPRTVIQSGLPAPIDQEDVIEPFPFRAMQDAGLDPASEPQLTIVLP